MSMLKQLTITQGYIMNIGKIERINVTFDSEELSDLAFTLKKGLELTIKTHINTARDAYKRGYPFRLELFKEQNGRSLDMMKTFLALSGRMDGNYYEKELFGMIKKDEEIEK